LRRGSICADLKTDGNLPEAKEQFARFVNRTAKVALHDFIRDTGTMSTGEDLERDIIREETKESETGENTVKAVVGRGGGTAGSHTLIKFTAIVFLMSINLSTKNLQNSTADKVLDNI